MKNIILIGYSGHGFVAADIFFEMGCTIVGYCDDEEKSQDPFGLKYLGKEKDYFLSTDIEKSKYEVFISIGKSATREHVFNFLQQQSIAVSNAVHPKAIFARKTSIGAGVLIAANATINPMVRIGNGVICNTASSIDHECIVGDFAHICPGTTLCGNVTIGRHAFIGAGSVVKPGVTICDDAMIGAGSVVVNHITTPGIYAGNPAKQLVDGKK